MATYGVTDYATRSGVASIIEVWSGAFYSDWEASSAPIRSGVRSFTLTTYNGDKVRVILPDGVTMPRTEANFLAIDKAVSDALNAHYGVTP